MLDDSGLVPDPRIGSLVDERYQVIEAMAAGSMGVVYKAERVPVGKLVAIKFLHAPFANDSEFLARFERETRVMSKLTHPNCVSVVDFGVWDGAPYLVMEYVSGTTLRSLIDNGPLPIRRALALIRQIAAGLAHAHAQGVVHRDVKPANIMVSEEIGTGDHARILDFGLARLRGSVGRDATQSNVVVGTPNYMAPEQTVGGGLIDARTDIYAAGVVLFEMVSGERPFQAEDTLALLGMHRAAPIPRLTDRMEDASQLPHGLQDVIDKAMAKSPSDRFQSAIELAEAIDQVTSGRSDEPLRRGTEARKAAGMAPTLLDVSDDVELLDSQPPPLPRRARRRRGSFLGSLILLAILAGGVGAAVLWIKGRGKPAAMPPHGAVASPSTGGAAASSGPSRAADPGRAAGSAVAETAGATDPSGSAGSAAAAAQDPVSAGSAGSAESPRTGSESAIQAGSDQSGSAEPATGAGGPPSQAGANPEPTTAVGSATGSAAGPPAGSAAPGPSAGSQAPPSAGSEPAPTGAVAAPRAAELAAGSGERAEVDMDPATAVDPAPPSTRPASGEEEAANAPATVEEAEKRKAVAPVLAGTLESAVQLAKDGKRDLALASLRTLWKKTPNSAYIPFLIGNLYYDERWWTVAMEHYGTAIKKNARYRSNPTISRNVISMLVSDKTSRKAQGFLKYVVGKPAAPYVRYAAAHDPNPKVRRTAGWLLRNL